MDRLFPEFRNVIMIAIKAIYIAATILISERNRWLEGFFQNQNSKFRSQWRHWCGNEFTSIRMAHPISNLFIIAYQLIKQETLKNMLKFNEFWTWYFEQIHFCSNDVTALGTILLSIRRVNFDFKGWYLEWRQAFLIR